MTKWFTRTVCGLFILVLLLPGFGILREKRNKELILEMETRTINPKPTAKLFTSKYFSQFENWFNDRILGRKELVRGWAQLNGKLFHTLISKEVEMGKDDFLFMPFNAKHELLDADKKQAIISKILAACKKHNAKMYFFLAPHSEWIQSELLPDKYGKIDLKAIDQEMLAFLPKDVQYVSMLSTLADMSSEERTKLYYRGDYHWNSMGAYLGAQTVVKAMGYNDLLDKPVKYLDLSVGSADIYTRKIGWKPIINKVQKPWNDVYSTDFKYYCGTAGVIKEAAAKEADSYSHRGEMIIVNPKAKNKATVLVLGDSFMGAMQEYLMQDVERVVVLHNSDISSPKKSIDIDYLLTTYKPDALLYAKMGSFFYNYRYEEIFSKYVVE